MTQTLITRIRDDALASRKARDAARSAFLTTLMADIARVGKDAGSRETTEAEAVAIINRFIKNTNEALRLIRPAADPAKALACTQLDLELSLLLAYLPAQASQADLESALVLIVAQLPDNSSKQMGVVMGKLQAQFDGNFDKALASKLVRDALAAKS